MAVSVSSRASLTADLGWPGPRIESQLPGAAPYSHCRPIAGIGERRVRSDSVQSGCRASCGCETCRSWPHGFDVAKCWRGGFAVVRPRTVPSSLRQLHADLAAALRCLALPVETRAFRPISPWRGAAREGRRCLRPRRCAGACVAMCWCTLVCQRHVCGPALALDKAGVRDGDDCARPPRRGSEAQARQDGRALNLHRIQQHRVEL